MKDLNGENKDGKLYKTVLCCMYCTLYLLHETYVFVCILYIHFIKRMHSLPHFHFAFMQTEQLSIHPRFIVQNFTLSISLIEYICKCWTKKHTFIYLRLFQLLYSFLNDNCVTSRSDRCTEFELTRASSSLIYLFYFFYSFYLFEFSSELPYVWMWFVSYL